MQFNMTDYSLWEFQLSINGTEITFAEDVRIPGIVGKARGKQYIDIHHQDWHSVIQVNATFTWKDFHGTVTQIDEVSLQTGTIRVHVALQPLKTGQQDAPE